MFMLKKKYIFGFFSTQKSIKQRWNMLLTFYNYLVKKLYLNNYPISLTIDPCNLCNLNCELCPSGLKIPGRKQSIMRFDIFKKIIDECGPYLWDIYLFNWGEPLLNKELFRMIEYAKKYHIDTTVSTNLNYFNEEVCKKLIESGLDILIVSLDGASQNSVQHYQKGSDFELVVSNMERIVKLKNKLDSKLPLVQWRYLENTLNEHEIEKAKTLAKQLGIDKLEIASFRCNMADELFLNNENQYQNVKSWLPKDEKLSMYDYKRKKKKKIKKLCRLLWFESVVNPYGSISPCCASWYERDDFGNISSSSFIEIWNNQEYKTARRIYTNRKKIPMESNICYVCYKNKAII